MGSNDGVGGQCDLVPLEILLQQCLGVLAERARIDVIQNRHVEALDHRLSGVEAAVEKHCTEYRFQRVSEDGRSTKAAAAQFALAEPQAFRNIEGLSDLIQRLLLDQVCPHAREIPLVQLAEPLEQKRSHCA